MNPDIGALSWGISTFFLNVAHVILMCSQMFGPLHSMRKKREREKDGTGWQRAWDLHCNCVRIFENGSNKTNEALRLCTKILKQLWTFPGTFLSCGTGHCTTQLLL